MVDVAQASVRASSALVTANFIPKNTLNELLRHYTCCANISLHLSSLPGLKLSDIVLKVRYKQGSHMHRVVAPIV